MMRLEFPLDLDAAFAAASDFVDFPFDLSKERVPELDEEFPQWLRDLTGMTSWTEFHGCQRQHIVSVKSLRKRIEENSGAKLSKAELRELCEQVERERRECGLETFAERNGFRCLNDFCPDDERGAFALPQRLRRVAVTPRDVEPLLAGAELVKHLLPRWCVPLLGVPDRVGSSPFHQAQTVLRGRDSLAWKLSLQHLEHLRAACFEDDHDGFAQKHFSRLKRTDVSLVREACFAVASFHTTLLEGGADSAFSRVAPAAGAADDGVQRFGTFDTNDTNESDAAKALAQLDMVRFMRHVLDFEQPTLFSESRRDEPRRARCHQKSQFRLVKRALDAAIAVLDSSVGRGGGADGKNVGGDAGENCRLLRRCEALRDRLSQPLGDDTLVSPDVFVRRVMRWIFGWRNADKFVLRLADVEALQLKLQSHKVWSLLDDFGGRDGFGRIRSPEDACIALAPLIMRVGEPLGDGREYQYPPCEALVRCLELGRDPSLATTEEMRAWHAQIVQDMSKGWTISGNADKPDDCRQRASRACATLWSIWTIREAPAAECAAAILRRRCSPSTRQAISRFIWGDPDAADTGDFGHLVKSAHRDLCPPSSHP